MIYDQPRFLPLPMYGSEAAGYASDKEASTRAQCGLRVCGRESQQVDSVGVADMQTLIDKEEPQQAVGEALLGVKPMSRLNDCKVHFRHGRVRRDGVVPSGGPNGPAERPKSVLGYMREFHTI